MAGICHVEVKESWTCTGTGHWCIQNLALWACTVHRQNRQSQARMLKWDRVKGRVLHRETQQVTNQVSTWFHCTGCSMVGRCTPACPSRSDCAEQRVNIPVNFCTWFQSWGQQTEALCRRKWSSKRLIEPLCGFKSLLVTHLICASNLQHVHNWPLVAKAANKNIL